MIHKRHILTACTFFLTALLITLGLTLGSSWARAADEDYNFSWLDPDKKIYVWQNRKYEKAGHALISAMVGVGWSNPYRDTFNIDPRVAYYFSEDFGIEFFYEVTSNSDSDTFNALKHVDQNALPIVREITGQFGGLLHWTPWYAKINVFNQILYFDWYLEGGAGTVQSRVDQNTLASGSPNYKTDDLFGLFIGTGHQFYLSQMFVVRLDVLASFYSAQQYGTSGDKQWFSNYNFTAGLGLRL